ncbi:hypothetical protein DC083_08970 [Ignatzschineria ureiclastica]|uniref:MotA/TolQ/ExbB proton channel domain-containing protein n=1 Tax=Ignatzschineria ureiclastica TaxID=472582 RepID=A0A2U2ACQ1_9GAMM|nr:anti-phage ZorAB system protein ZorA [Ignatzschineria ureiclastica]PWD80436.1 hypothetical protein DC083_08970 [Ignatzschineria ureiclastica]GGZ99538.1 hypothetical protein GCM10007162_14610 [Ignatzschineria ureiclastica]
MKDVFLNLLPDFSSLFQLHEDGLTALFILILFAICVYCCSYIFVKKRSSIHKINSLVQLFQKYKDQDVYLQKYEFEQDISAIRDLKTGELAKDYKDTLIFNSQDEKVYSSIDSEYYFNTETLASAITHNRLLSSIPSLLVAAGVLGTFVGLVTGLRGLDIHSDEIEVLKSGIGQLVAGISFAFMTSIWGVLLSLILNFVEKSVERSITTKIDNLNGLIQEIFPAITSEQNLQKIANNTEESKEALQELHEKLGSTMQEAVRGLSQGLEEAITVALNNVMKPAIDSLITTTQDHSTAALEGLIDRFTDGLHSAGKAQEMQLRAAGDTVNQAALQMGTELKSFLEVQQQQATQISEQEQARQEIVNQQLAQMREQYESFLQSTSESEKAQQEVTARLLSQHEALLTQLQNVTETMRINGQHLDNSSNQLGLLSNNLKQLVDSFNETLVHVAQNVEKASEKNNEVATLLDSQFDALAEISMSLKETCNVLGRSAELANDGFKNLEEHQTKFLDDLGNEFAGITDLLVGEVDRLKESVRESLIDYNEQVTNQIADRFKEWNTQTISFANNMSKIVATIGDLVDEIEVKSKYSGKF